ncbi:glycosyltransferase family 2 protein [Paenibacillus solani]|uniref:Glycosyl transferase family 2 n=1 Tax=Paenibacillus solani TaxID=1705565 RepID=A0A0M1P0Y0_9BACL|nr:glycosyltransferase family A protein [Paenibacillus solani]KOR88121.1 glycosyl transferase family 2 [Paenibacillus solani]
MRRRGARLRKSLTVAPPKADPVEGRKDGYMIGYSYGVQHGKKESDCSFDGVSIIIPIQDPFEDVISKIRRIEALTPHPYELLIADVGSSEGTKKYMRSRIGVVRHIVGRSDQGIAVVLNKALHAAHGKKLVILYGCTPVMDNWIGSMTDELDNASATKSVCVNFAQTGVPLLPREELDSHNRLNACCALFRPELLSDVGWLDVGLPSLQENMSEWLGRVPLQYRTMLQADGIFV